MQVALASGIAIRQAQGKEWTCRDSPTIHWWCFSVERKMGGWKKYFDPSKTPKFRVELHVHLEGAIRPETLWELSQ
ncbi:hypothetical protein TNCV_1301951 [Trichonephila clavipes]|nr:hypothetical protein TNCV_1301951 [Trichonephila clavipes]